MMVAVTPARTHSLWLRERVPTGRHSLLPCGARRPRQDVQQLLARAQWALPRRARHRVDQAHQFERPHAIKSPNPEPLEKILLS
jgi:hypothetical protein